MGAVAAPDAEDAVDGVICKGGVQVGRALAVAGSQIAVAVFLLTGGEHDGGETQVPDGLHSQREPLGRNGGGGPHQGHPGAGKERFWGNHGNTTRKKNV